MATKILLPCLLLGLVDANAFPSCDVTTTEAVLAETTEEPVSAIPLELQVQGQSGKFTLVPQGSSGDSVGLRVTMDALREVDADGNAVGTSGSVKHSINTFASQAFTVGEMETVLIGSGVSAAKVSFESTISQIGRIGVDTYVMAQAGTVGMSNESWDVNIGDLKWNIRLWDWTWCDGGNCQQGQTEEVGAFVELDITVQNLGGGSASRGSGKSVSGQQRDARAVDPGAERLRVGAAAGRVPFYQHSGQQHHHHFPLPTLRDLLPVRSSCAERSGRVRYRRRLRRGLSHPSPSTRGRRHDHQR